MTTPVTSIPAILARPRATLCKVCGLHSHTGPLCEYCRKDLFYTLQGLTNQQNAIVARMAGDSQALDNAINAANDDELIRYQKLLAARKSAQTQFDLGSSAAMTEFSRRYDVTKNLSDGLGCIVRADERVSTAWRDVELLNTLQDKIAAVEAAIEGLRENG